MERLVVLHRPEGHAWGITLAGGGSSPITISKIQPGTIASEAGTVSVGEILVSVNGTDVSGSQSFQVRKP